MTNVGVDEDRDDTVSIGKYLSTFRGRLLSPYPLQDGISQTQRMKAVSSTGMLPISTVSFQDLTPISDNKCGKGWVGVGWEWLRQVLHSSNSYKIKCS
jgi:hypothetical protein